MTTLTARAAGAVLAASLAVPAFAGGMEPPVLDEVIAPAPLAPVPAGHDWTGGYGGLLLSYGDLSDGLDGNGALGGVQAGYDWDLGNWVVGLGADANFGNIDTDEGSLDSISRLKVRGGYDLGRTLVYVTTGASYAASDDLQDAWGYFGGVGAETMLSDRVSLSGEVSANRFQDYRDFGTVNATVASLGLNYRF